VVRWKVNRGMGKIVMGFRGVRIVELVRQFGEMKIVMGFSGVGFVKRVRRFGEMKIAYKIFT
jgi:hypothetical protein